MKFKTHIFIDDNTFWGTSELSLVVSSLLSFDVSKVLVTKSVKRFSSKLHDAQKKIAKFQTGRFVFARIRHVCFKHRLILVSGHRINFAHRLSAITSAHSRVYRACTFESTALIIFRRLRDTLVCFTIHGFVSSRHETGRFDTLRPNGRDAPVDTRCTTPRAPRIKHCPTLGSGGERRQTNLRPREPS